ncbi:helix-turn-helix transcriptional regulator [Aurantibacter crassamenti]|uniref:winged helix-turn-helix transcriptional regulator n=1 Tax=Aurantibacter crassamenti TaxID=1837375 RepID=UPI0019392758|nr:helix-turn-helix domain-containing protein [Aurantibacter crassamenti]MBM1107058.1 helix-turn-helix transcriptional regulator [Aurantibacter crassamenti]
MKAPKRRSQCPISTSLEVWGDKWSLLIIRDLMFNKRYTYGDFLKSEEKISTNILAARLLMLEKNDLIEKLEHPDSKAKVLYQLTPKGIDLIPVIVEINLWAEKYFSLTAEKKSLLNEIKLNKEKFIATTMNSLLQP